MQLVKLHRGKDRSTVSLHINPTTFSTAGLQTTDMLSFLGFESGPCPFLRGSCFARVVPEDTSLARFAQAFARYSELMLDAEKNLQACGYRFPQPEGWGHFFGRRSPYRTLRPQARGDGHRAATHKRMKEDEDHHFWYVFSWIEADSERGWVTHYRWKDAASLEMMRQFTRMFPEVKSFEECPEFDFEPCYWRFEAYETTGGAWRDNAHWAHGHFDAHSESFSGGLSSLLAADAVAEDLGFVGTAARAGRSASARDPRPARKGAASIVGEGSRDVFLCHAGEDKAGVLSPLCGALDQGQISYWYDEAEINWGDSVTAQVNRGLAVSRYVIVVLSKHFVGKPWPERELNAALNIESSTGEVKVLPLLVGDGETVQALVRAYPLLNDKRYLVWKGHGEDVVRELQRWLNRD